MRTIYVDSEYRCHLVSDGTMTAVETDFFDGKCDTFLEGYRLIPAGETWASEDGTVFSGEMLAPWKDYGELDEAQRAYERDLLADAETALAILLGGAV